MKLRRWQSESLSRAYEQYCSNVRHFMCLATPGAGKTIMAALLAKQLFEAGMIDMVLCFSPSIIVADDFRKELEVWTSKRLNGRLGADGCSLTYQAMSSLDKSFWEILDNYRVFVIFDEIHHCAAAEEGKNNIWGKTIRRHIRGKAAYTLALTGTPWRSDKVPIVLADYCQESGKVHCDYRYGLGEAISDGVCREPKIHAVDNTQISVKDGSESYSYSSFDELLMQSDCSYQNILDNETLITEILRRAGRKLDSLRKRAPNAGGLIVATSVSHARKIAYLLQMQLNETSEIVTYADENPLSTIHEFRKGTSKWIISVGMISEGTNLPRLKVCCYLTRVKTELYFRQVLGRILRATGQSGEKGHLFMPAEPTLIEYAQRVSEDIPESNILTIEPVIPVEEESVISSSLSCRQDGEGAKCKPEIEISIDQIEQIGSIGQTEHQSTLAQSYEACINISGKFVHKLLEIDAVDFSGHGNPSVVA